MSATTLEHVLGGYVVLVTADRRSGDIAAALTRRGASVRHAPALSIVPHLDDAALVAATERLLDDPPDVIVATTGIGFRGWLEAADAAGLGERLHPVLAAARIVARGPKANGAVQQAGLRPDWVAESETSAELLEYLLAEGVSEQCVAVQHHGAGSDGIDEALAGAGARVVPLVVYRWGPPNDPGALAQSTVAVAAGEIDVVLFTSAPGATAWLAAAEAAGTLPTIVERCTSGDTIALAVGPVTAAPLVAAGIVPVAPDRGRLGSMIRALVGHVQGREGDVDTRAGTLRVLRSAALLDGTPIPLTPGGLAVLRVLADAGGRVVSRQELLAALPGDSADPHTAEVAVARVRDAVGPDLIHTVVKRGYRLAI
ncbi:MAG: uroporphyrinogen-III synthase [Dermatophilaceae bacterium]